jgi:hypothetical protein
MESVQNAQPREAKISYGVGTLVLGSSWNGEAKATYLKDLSNGDIKTKFKMEISSQAYYGGGGTIALYLDGTKFYSDTIECNGGKFSCTNSKDYLVELVKDIENPNLYHVQVNGLEISTTNIGKQFSYDFVGTTSGTLTIDYLKSRPYYNCQVENDEVVVRDVFTSGSLFTIKDLTYTPVKFCVDSYPAIKRSFLAQGVRADIQGQITKKLTTGQSILVEPQTTLEIYYIADYIEGMGERCGLDSAYDTQENKCVKIISEAEDVVEIINNVSYISVGENQLLFDNSVAIGEKELSSLPPSYLCKAEKPKANAPLPREECWTTSVSYDGVTLPIKSGQEVSFKNGLVKVKYYPEAQFKDDQIQAGWKNHFVLTLSTAILSLKVNPTTEYYLLFGTDKKVEYEITNNLGTLNTAGVQILTTKKLLTSQNSNQQTFNLKSGLNKMSYVLDTKEYGEAEVQIVPFIKVGGKTFFDNEKITRNYNVVDKIPTDTIYQDKIIEVEKQYSFKELLGKLWEMILGWFR